MGVLQIQFVLTVTGTVDYILYVGGEAYKKDTYRRESKGRRCCLAEEMIQFFAALAILTLSSFGGTFGGRGGERGRGRRGKGWYSENVFLPGEYSKNLLLYVSFS